MKKIFLLFYLVILGLTVQQAKADSLILSGEITGATTWSSSNQNHLTIPLQDFPRQNADYQNRLSYTKLDATGKTVPDSATSWSCVRDNISGLVWEVKTSDNGLHGKAHTYTWYNSKANSSDTSEGTEGEPGDTTCGDPASVSTGCDTEKFVNAVNTSGWCGQKDWRLPTVTELSSIANYGTSLPAISKNFFPDLIMPAGFWSSSPYSANSNFAWIVIFDDGYVGSCVKSWAYYVRLVRGGN